MCARCFQVATLGASLLLLYFSMFQSLLRRACFRQVCVAQPMLLPGTFFHANFLFVSPKSHMCLLPHVGFSQGKKCLHMWFFFRCLGQDLAGGPRQGQNLTRFRVKIRLGLAQGFNLSEMEGQHVAYLVICIVHSRRGKSCFSSPSGCQ